MKKYGIMGGTFNPPHMAHSTLALKAKELLSLDKILFIPSAVPPLKNSDEVLEIKHRLAMAKIAFEGIPGSEVSDIEIKNSNGKSFTVDTLERLHAIYENDSVKFYLLIGIDSLADFPRWKNPDKLFKLAEIVMLNRPGYSLEGIKPVYLDKVIILDLPLMDISSTMIREKVKNNTSIKSLVLPEIEKYIKQNNLYK